jgi:hypothetical protein
MNASFGISSLMTSRASDSDIMIEGWGRMTTRRFTALAISATKPPVNRLGDFVMMAMLAASKSTSWSISLGTILAIFALISL